MTADIEINGVPIGPGNPVYVIAEAGVNHNGNAAQARALIDAAAEAGAQAVKFQTFRADKLVSKAAPKAEYQMSTTDPTESQFDMIRKLELGEDMHAGLMVHCMLKNITFLSSPFDEESASLLEKLNVSAFKIPSGEVINLAFLEHVAGFRKPILLSTGMSDLDEVERAVETIRSAGNEKLVVLHCVSNYPADPADANLLAMSAMEGAFDLPVGYSDHVPGNAVALAAVAMGACVIEKHFTLDKNMDGPDHKASAEPHELAELIRSIREVESALGDGEKRPADNEKSTAEAVRKSLVAARDLTEGTVLDAGMIAAKRPGTGLVPSRLDDIVGKKLKTDLAADTLIDLEDLE
jgi:N-acetylneuraminate synthase